MNLNNKKIAHLKEEIKEYERTIKRIREKPYSIFAVNSKMALGGIAIATSVYILFALLTTGFSASKFSQPYSGYDSR